MKTLAIVILNYNGRAHLETYLPSVVANLEGHELYIIDNGSTDDSIDFLNNNYSSIKQINLAVNVGFAQGYNDGLKKIEGQYTHYLLLNSDVRLTPHCISPLLHRLQDEKIAAVQPKVLSDKKPSHFEHAGACGGFLDKNAFPFCRGRIFDFCEEDLGQYNQAISVFWATGACLMIKSKCFHDAGGFDGRFFAHMEEIDLCWRLQHAGYEIWVEPKSQVYHLGGGTLSYESARKVFLNFRNNLFMLVKNETGNWILKLIRRMAWDGLAAFQFMVKGKFTLVYQVFKAHMQLYTSFGYLYRQRKSYENQRIKGRYSGNIVIDHFLKKIKTFSDLRL